MLVYVKDEDAGKNYIVTLTPGTGDNLLPEDVEEGYAGYINCAVDEFVGHAEDDCGFISGDSDVYMCSEKEMERIRNGNMKYIMEDVLSYLFFDHPQYDGLPSSMKYKIVDEALED